MSLKLFTFFTHIFRYSWCRITQIIPCLLISVFFVNYSGNLRIFLGGSMGKRQAEVCQIFFYLFYLAKVVITEAEEFKVLPK